MSQNGPYPGEPYAEPSDPWNQPAPPWEPAGVIPQQQQPQEQQPILRPQSLELPQQWQQGPQRYEGARRQHEVAEPLVELKPLELEPLAQPRPLLALTRS